MTRKCPGHGPSDRELYYCDGSCQRPIHGQTRSDTSAQIRQVPERGKVHKALFELFAEWETQVSADSSELRYAPLADKADAFIDAMAGYVEHQRTADSPAWLAEHRVQGESGRIDHAFTPVLNWADFPDCVYDIAPGYICGYPESAHKSDHAAPGPGDGK